MILRYSKDVSINIEIEKSNHPEPINVVFLHGFTGSSMDWLPFFESMTGNINNYSVDLIGHGKSSAPADISFYTTKSIIDQLHYTLSALKLSNVILVGYSLGGRAALAYINEYPHLIKGLVLESTSPGISEVDKKEQRFQSDLELAKMIEEQGVEKFIDYWMNLPLFQTQSKLGKDTLTKLRKAKLNNNKIGLANSLRGFSTGIMPHFWNELDDITCKTLLITGNLDKKFTEMNNKMLSDLKNAEHIIVDDCGHNVHLEKPKTFINLLNKYISEI